MAKAGEDSSARVPWGKCRDYDKESYELVTAKIAAGDLSVPPNAGDIAFQIATIARAADAERLEGYFVGFIAEAWRDHWWTELRDDLIKQERAAESRTKSGSYQNSGSGLPQLKRLKRLSEEQALLLDHGEVMNALRSALKGMWHPDDYERRGLLEGYDEEAVFREAVALLCEASSLAISRLQSRPPRGRPSGMGWEWEYFSERMLELLQQVRAAGGRLTVDKNTNSGTLLEAYSLLESVLPANYWPCRPANSWFARVKKLDRKMPDRDTFERILLP